MHKPNRAAARVLVLGRGERAFLATIRSLGRAGLTVDVGMCGREELALASRYVSRIHDIPQFRPDDDAWLRALTAILKETPYQLVIPCNDQAVIPLQMHKKTLERLCRLATLSDYAFRVAFDKIESYELARALRIPVPEGRLVSSKDSVDDILSDFSLPLILKPRSSFTPDAIMHKRAVVRARTREGLENYLRAFQDPGGVLVQSNFIGIGVGVELLVKDGTTLFVFQHQRVHEPLEGGGSSYRTSTALHPELLAASKVLMGALRYTGVAMIEFKCNPATGEWVFVEINGRFWGSLPLAIAAGADFPAYLYEMLVEGRTDFPAAYRSGLYCRNLRLDVRWIRSNIGADRRDPTLATRPMLTVAAETANLLTYRERWDTFALDDPKVWLVECGRAIRALTHAAVQGVRRGVAANWLARRVAARRMSRRIRSATTIVFVCKGNICRSPFAEQYARSIFPAEVEILSAGYYPASGRRAPPTALAAARYFDVELAPHRSRVLTGEIVDAADLILTFDEENFRKVRDTYPGASRKVFRLGGILERNDFSIADPYGHDLARFDSVFRQIVRAIDRLAQNSNWRSPRSEVQAETAARDLSGRRRPTPGGETIAGRCQTLR